MKYLIASIYMTVFLGCSGTKEVTPSAPEPLQGSFKVVQVTGTDLGMIVPTILINSTDSRLSGYAGCNTYTARYARTENSLSINNVGTTKMACIQGMEQERTFTQAMEKVNRHSLENGVLTLFEDETVLIKAQRTEI